MTPSLVIMARAPAPGHTKTRLQPLLGAAGCALLQTALIRQSVMLAGEIPQGGAFLCYTPTSAEELLRPLVDPKITMFPQEGTDLGQRMAAATAIAAARRPGPVVVIGTDCPVLGARHLDAAAERLADGCDVVFGPASDGGYYLVAVAKPAAEVFGLPALCWGGPDVLDRSVAAAAAAGLTVGLIDTENDLDTPADAATMLADSRLPHAIARLLATAMDAPGRG